MVRASIVGGAAVIALGVGAAVAAKVFRNSKGQVPTSVDVNTSDQETLQLIVHIGPERATRIIKLRATQPFASLEELAARVDGIGPASLREIRGQGLAYVAPQSAS